MITEHQIGEPLPALRRRAISESGKVSYEESYLASFQQWEPPREATPPFREMAKPIVCAVNGVGCGA